jgi:hypothetical protein
MPFTDPLQAFCSYAHEDRKFLLKFRKQSRPLDRVVPQYVRVWDDREISPGMDWSAAIHENARNAQLFVLLVSDDFLNSDYCLGVEYQLAIEKYERREAAVVPVVVRDCFWELLPQLQRFQVLPENGEPAGRKDKSWKQVVLGLKQSIDRLREGTFFRQEESGLAGADIPELLPYACGRDAHEEPFAEALKKAPRHRPFVCLLTGTDNQAHRQLIDRLIAKSTAVLEIAAGNAVYAPEPGLSWNQVAKPEDIAAELAATLSNPRPTDSTVEELSRAVSQHPGLTVIRSTWTSIQWRLNTGRLLSAFLNLWTKWPDLGAGQHLIVFLAVKYLKPPDQPANTSMAGEITRIRESPTLFRLDLSSIAATEAAKSLRADPEMKANYDVERIAGELEELPPKGEPLPMEELASQVGRLLVKYRK